MASNPHRLVRTGVLHTFVGNRVIFQRRLHPARKQDFKALSPILRSAQVLLSQENRNFLPFQYPTVFANLPPHPTKHLSLCQIE